MKRLIILLVIYLLVNILYGCVGQEKPGLINKDQKSLIGGAFENSTDYKQGIPNFIAAKDTSPGWYSNGQKLLLTGVVFKADAKTPCPNVLIYYYQTNTEGKYIHKPEEPRSMQPNKQGQTHGYIRGWVKTDSLGRYAIYTIRPGTYPTLDAPAHIHVTIKEPNNINEYYIDEFIFDDDKLVNSAYRKKMENRGGSGVLKLMNKDNLLIGERNIILGLNIPNYPQQKTTMLQSGRNIGEDVFSFIPTHAWGPDKGTTTCPICKYGWHHGILLFVSNNTSIDDIKMWLGFLENESKKRMKTLKVFLIYANENKFTNKGLDALLSNLGNELNIKHTALTFVPSFKDTASDVYLNKINSAANNTLIIYKRSKIIQKFINYKPTANNFKHIQQCLNESTNEYFYLPELKIN